MKKCPACNMEMEKPKFGSELVCKNCGYREKIQKEPVIKSEEKKAEAEPLQMELFNASPLKVALLSVCTLGLFHIYWFYRNWSCVQKKTGEKFSPGARALFYVFFCYGLFKRIINTAKSNGYTGNDSPGTFAAILIILSLMGRAEDPYWLISYLSFIPLLSMQNIINLHNAKINPEYKVDTKFHPKEIIIVIIGGMLVFFSILGTFTPGQQTTGNPAQTENTQLLPK